MASSFHFLALLALLCLAKTTTAILLPPLPDVSKSCLECTAIVKAMDVVFGDADNVAALVAKVEAKCGSHDVCKKIVDALITIPEGIFKGLRSVAWPDWGLCALVNECSAPCCNPLSSPEQVHLSLAATDRSLMGVSWVTLSGNSSIVEWGTEAHRLTSSAEGTSLTYTKAGWVGSIHRATLTNLLAGTRYYYRVGDGNHWSATFSFTTFEASPTKPIRLAIIADMAYDTNSDNTVKRLAALAEKGEIDAVVHSGDISYADGFQQHFDKYMNKVQDVAARVPYMVAVGNHEFGWNFAAYKARFYMPGSEGLDHQTVSSHDNMFYPWSIPYVQFFALSSETAVDTANFNKDNMEFLSSQLALVDRTKTPWVIAHFHRPMYCTQDSDCDKSAALLRAEAEEIFYKHKVDLAMCGHVHAYQRTVPVYKSALTPDATAYLLQGASGNREGNKGPYSADQPPFIANSQNDIGYGILTIAADGKTLSWEFRRSSDDAILDTATYSK